MMLHLEETIEPQLLSNGHKYKVANIEASIIFSLSDKAEIAVGTEKSLALN